MSREMGIDFKISEGKGILRVRKKQANTEKN